MKSGTDFIYLLDTNVIIDFVGSRFSPAYKADISSRIRNSECTISVVAVTEILAGKMNEQDKYQVENLIQQLSILEYTEELIPFGASIRRQFGLKLPDAMIAATAVRYGLTLITSDLRHFHKIDALQVERPELT